MNPDKFKDPHIVPDCICVDSSVSALLVWVPGKGTLWFPESNIAPESEIHKIGDQGKLIITQWLAKEKHLL